MAAAATVTRRAAVSANHGERHDMNDSPERVKDPVCEMMVSPEQHEAIHAGLRYAFCSLQCRERFVARPGLYVGVRGRRAPKQRGMRLIRQRHLSLGNTLVRDEEAALIAALREMMGVVDARYVEEPPAFTPLSQPRISEVLAAAAGIEVTYDLLQATAAQLEQRVAEVGGRLRDGPGEKVRREFVHYLEDCDLADLEVRDVRVLRARYAGHAGGSRFRRIS